MNIKDILKENGFDIVAEIGMKYFRLKFTEEELAKKIEFEKMYDFNIRGEFNLEISEIGFDGLGELYIVLTCLDDEHFKKGATFEIIDLGGD